MLSGQPKEQDLVSCPGCCELSDAEVAVVRAAVVVDVVEGFGYRSFVFN